MTFPLRARPAESYHERPRAFGSPRDGGARSHAGCDLYAAAGSDVLALESGTVTRGCYPFYDVVFALGQGPRMPTTRSFMTTRRSYPS